MSVLKRRVQFRLIASLTVFQRIHMSVLKRRVQVRLIASLTARAHGKVRSLSKSSWLVQPITEQSY